MTSTAPSDREIYVNGLRVASKAGTLATFLEEQGYGGRKVATALNGKFVPEQARAMTIITAGDRVEVVSARQGG